MEFKIISFPSILPLFLWRIPPRRWVIKFLPPCRWSPYLHASFTPCLSSLLPPCLPASLPPLLPACLRHCLPGFLMLPASLNPCLLSNDKLYLFRCAEVDQNLHCTKSGVDTGHWTVDSVLWTVDTWHWTVDSVLWTVDTGHWTVVSVLWTVDTWHWTPDIGQWTLDTGMWTLYLPLLKYQNVSKLPTYTKYMSICFNFIWNLEFISKHNQKKRLSVENDSRPLPPLQGWFLCKFLILFQYIG